MKNRSLLLRPSVVPMMLTTSLFFGCATKTKILDAGAVSMTHHGLKEGESLQETGPVTGEFCADQLHDKGSIGLMDEAIKNAQSENNVDFITNAAFYIDHKGCVTIDGTGNTIVSSGAPIPLSKRKH